MASMKKELCFSETTTLVYEYKYSFKQLTNVQYTIKYESSRIFFWYQLFLFTQWVVQVTQLLPMVSSFSSSLF